ncbi:MAG: sulfur carrier protein ThiS [Oscillospiraceae bacterium]|nr:sulfur carrier protein ThiS [Oscillospiraceae bacterium]
MITINGEKLEKSEIRLSDYLAEKKYKTERIAVELNGEILPKSQYETTVLKDGDKAEIVSFVGGG